MIVALVLKRFVKFAARKQVIDVCNVPSQSATDQKVVPLPPLRKNLDGSHGMLCRYAFRVQIQSLNLASTNGQLYQREAIPPTKAKAKQTPNGSNTTKVKAKQTSNGSNTTKAKAKQTWDGCLQNEDLRPKTQKRRPKNEDQFVLQAYQTSAEPVKPSQRFSSDTNLRETSGVFVL